MYIILYNVHAHVVLYMFHVVIFKTYSVARLLKQKIQKVVGS